MSWSAVRFLIVVNFENAQTDTIHQPTENMCDWNTYNANWSKFKKTCMKKTYMHTYPKYKSTGACSLVRTAHLGAYYCAQVWDTIQHSTIPVIFSLMFSDHIDYTILQYQSWIRQPCDIATPRGRSEMISCTNARLACVLLSRRCRQQQLHEHI